MAVDTAFRQITLSALKARAKKKQVTVTNTADGYTLVNDRNGDVIAEIPRQADYDNGIFALEEKINWIDAP